jgi:hypothetical protein
MTPAEDFGQLRLKFTDPGQHHYEVIRPMVLYSETISERSRQTGIERTQVGERTKRFIQKGMFGLVDQRTKKSGGQVHEYPEAVAGHILYLKQLYHRSITERLSGSLNTNMGIKPIITRSKAFWSVILFRFNSNWISLIFTVLKMPIRPAGR